MTAADATLRGVTDDLELIARIRAAIDSDERLACEADPAPTPEDVEAGRGQSGWEDPYGEFQSRGGPVFAHVLRHKPSRVLRRIAADRKILDLHSDQHECTDQTASAYPYVGCETVRMLADAYGVTDGVKETAA